MSTPLYTTLPNSTSTRVLTIYPCSTDSETLSASLAIIDIDKYPRFDAVSYTWGTDLDEQEIIVDGHRLRIRKNLHDFLLQLRREKQRRAIWIDALSISQTDLDEKAQQVQMIGRIFGAARRVFVWTGLHADGSEKLFRDIKARTSVLGMARGLMTSKKASKSKDQESNVLAWINFINRPYFGRVWIIQELALAQGLTVYSGDDSLDWQPLIESSAGLRGVRNQLGQISAGEARVVHQRGDTRHGQLGAGMLDIIIALRRSAQKDDEVGDVEQKSAREISMLSREFQHAECSDRRDRIYALLSLEYLPQERSPYRDLEPLVVDYTIDIPNLFIATCRQRLAISHENIPLSSNDPSLVMFRDIEASMKLLGQPILLESRHVEVTAGLIEGLILTPAELNTILETVATGIRETAAEWKWWCYLAGLVVVAMFVEGEKWESPSRRESTAIPQQMQESIRKALLRDGIGIVGEYLRSL